MRSIRRLRAYPGYVGDLFRYLRSPGAESWSSISLRPMLEDKTATTGFDAHYVYLGAWAFLQIVTHRPERHVDVGAQIGWVTCLASITQVVFLDVRPFPGSVENLRSQAGDVLALPFGDVELSSLSCLHVAEHIGLGGTAMPSTHWGPARPSGSWPACWRWAVACTSRSPSGVPRSCSTRIAFTIPRRFPGGSVKRGCGWTSSRPWMTVAASAPTPNRETFGTSDTRAACISCGAECRRRGRAEASIPVAV